SRRRTRTSSTASTSSRRRRATRPCHTAALPLVHGWEGRMSSEHVLVLGAGYAGQMAAARLALRAPDTALTVVDASATFVERIRLHQLAAGGRVAARPMRALLPRRAAFVQGRVVGWDAAARRVTVEAEGRRADLAYTRCVYAL